MKLIKLFSLLIIFLYYFTFPLPTYAVGNWEFSGSMLNTHWFPNAIVLKNGKVLVPNTVGSPPNAPSEIYDANTRKWNATGKVNLPRDQFNPVLLDDGTVLIAGGQFGTSSGPTESAELYNPSTGLWQYTGSLNVPRQAAILKKLPGGNVIAIGGLFTATVEKYSPITKSWTLVQNSNTPRGGTERDAIVLDDGSLLVIGNPNEATTKVELFDPNTNSWSYTGDLLEPRVSATLVKLQDGKILMVNGISDMGFTKDAEIYDPKTHIWNPASQSSFARHITNAVLLQDGQVLVAGGSNGINEELTNTELYNPKTDSWSTGVSLNIGHHGANMVQLQNGDMLIAGGFSDLVNTTITNTTEIFTQTIASNPTNKEECRHKHWQRYQSHKFKNEENCIDWVKKHQSNKNTLHSKK